MHSFALIILNFRQSPYTLIKNGIHVHRIENVATHEVYNQGDVFEPPCYNNYEKSIMRNPQALTCGTVCVVIGQKIIGSLKERL